MKILTEKEYAEIIARLDKLEAHRRQTQKLNTDAFYHSQQFLEVMKISPRTAHGWRKQGLIAYSQVDGKIYYKHSDILDLLNRNYTPVSKKKAC